MASSNKKFTKDLDKVLYLNDMLFTDFSPATMLQGDNISQLSKFITDMMCKPQLYKKRLMVNTLSCLLNSWEEDVAMCDVLDGCLLFLLDAEDEEEVLTIRRSDDENFCMFAEALLVLCKNGRLKAEVASRAVKIILNFTDSENRSVMIRRMWMEKDDLGLPTETLEQLVLKQPILVEELLVDSALRVARAGEDELEDMIKAVLAEPAVVCVLDVCACSPRAFQVVTSMLHSLVCSTAPDVAVLHLSREVASAVSSRLRGLGSIVPLLPPDQQALALCLQIDPNLLPDGRLDAQLQYIISTGHAVDQLSKASILQTIAAGLAADPAGTSLLLMYYPEWLKLLSTHVTSAQVT